MILRQFLDYSLKYKEGKELRGIKKNCPSVFTYNLILRQFLDNSLKYKGKKKEELKRIVQQYLQIIWFLELDNSLKYKKEKEGRRITKNNGIIFKNNLILRILKQFLHNS